jgi:hypothetical protein
MNCEPYEIADVVLVARRLIDGYIVWSEDDYTPNPPCNRRRPGNDAAQEAAADLNNNGFADVADLVRFINIINDYMLPKLDPISGKVSVSMSDLISGSMEVRASSDLDIGGALMTIRHQGFTLGTPIPAAGMQLLSQDSNGVLKVLVYSLTGHSIPAGNSLLFTLSEISGANGSMTLAEVSMSDAYGRLLEILSGSDVPLPASTFLEQNYPNPFNPSTALKLALADDGDVSLTIYDVGGRKIRRLVSGDLQAGYHEVVWDGRTDSGDDAATGIYFARLQHKSVDKTIRMTLIK